MYFHQFDTIRYCTFESLEDKRIVHAVITRNGGISPAPWESLNLGGTVGDDPARVSENRRRALQVIGRSHETIYDVWQVHSAEVICTDGPRASNSPHLKADAILTDQPGVTLFMRFADCVPLLLFDPLNEVIGLVHAGWLGTVRQVVKAALETMCTQYGSRPENILAGIGPSIGMHHYPVGPEVAAQVKASFGQDASGLLYTTNGEIQFDLWSANQLMLEQAGVRFIEVAGLCTACHAEDWYSHRQENGKTGRFGVLISLNTSG